MATRGDRDDDARWTRILSSGEEAPGLSLAQRKRMCERIAGQAKRLSAPRARARVRVRVLLAHSAAWMLLFLAGYVLGRHGASPRPTGSGAGRVGVPSVAPTAQEPVRDPQPALQVEWDDSPQSGGLFALVRTNARATSSSGV